VGINVVFLLKERDTWEGDCWWSRRNVQMGDV